jgi:hypothetical protein
MHMKKLVILALAGVVLTGCAMSKTLPDGKHISNPSLPTMSQLPDPQWAGGDTVPSAYGHPLRPFAIILHPVGKVFDYALMWPFYALGGLAPGWFGVTTDDAHVFHSRQPDLVEWKDAPRHLSE